jgi:serine protease AprX
MSRLVPKEHGKTWMARGDWPRALLLAGLILSAACAQVVEPAHALIARDDANASPDPRRSAQPAPNMVDVIIYLKVQPVAQIAPAVQAQFAPSQERIRQQIRQIYVAASAQNPEALANSMVPGVQGLPEGQQAQARELSVQLETTMEEMRREIVRRAQPEVEASQTALVQWLESVGAVVYARLTIVNAVTAAVPREQLDVLEARPYVADVVADQKMTSYLNASHYAVYNTWQDQGYWGGPWDPAILDSGVDQSHPALDHASWSSQICLKAARNPPQDKTSNDVNGHGTHVAGIILSNDSSYWGLAWGTEKAFNLKAGYDEDGTDEGVASMYWADMMDCVNWSLTVPSDVADVFNLSYGAYSTPMPDDTAAARFWDAVVSTMQTPATIAAGNCEPAGSCSVGDPGIAYNVLTVANIDDRNTADAINPRRGDDTINPSSSPGPTSGGRRKPDIAAPGTNIWSTNNDWEGDSSDWAQSTGTSMAAPHVAGALLLLDEYGLTDPKLQKAILISTADDKGPAGWDGQYGWGYMNLQRAWNHKDDWFSDDIAPAPDYRLYRGSCLGGAAALVWNRRAVWNGSSEPATVYTLSNLDLYLYRETNDSLASSDTTVVDNVQVVRCGDSFDAVIKVDAASASFEGVATEAYALATGGDFVAASGPAFTFGSSGPPLCAGGQAEVSLPVNNVGDLDAHDVDVSLSLPAGLSLASGANPQSLGDLTDGSSKSANWTLNVNDAGTYVVPVSASSSSYGELFTSSDSLEIAVLSTRPPSPSLAAPSNGSALSAGTPTFRWSAVTGVTSYRIQVGNDSTLAEPFIDTTTSSTSYSPQATLAPGSYYWRVSASNACGEGPWTSVWTLTIPHVLHLPAVMKG